MKIVDILISAIMIIGVVALSFFWGCKLDLYVTVLAGVVVVLGTVVKIAQYASKGKKAAVSQAVQTIQTQTETTSNDFN